MRQWEMRFQLLHFRSLFSKRMFYQLEKKYMRFFAMKLATIVLGAENIRIALTQLISMNIIGDFFFLAIKSCQWWNGNVLLSAVTSVGHGHWSHSPFDVPIDRNKNALWKILKLIYIFSFDCFFCRYFLQWLFGFRSLLLSWHFTIQSRTFRTYFMAIHSYHEANEKPKWTAVQQHQPKKIVYYYILACASRTQQQQMPETTSVHNVLRKRRMWYGLGEKLSWTTRNTLILANGHSWMKRRKEMRKKKDCRSFIVVHCKLHFQLPRDAHLHTHSDLRTTEWIWPFMCVNGDN